MFFKISKWANVTDLVAKSYPLTKILVDKDFAHMTGPTNKWIVLEDDGRPVAVFSIEVNRVWDRHVHLSSLEVFEPYKNYGRACIDEIGRIVDKEGLDGITTYAYDENAEKFYLHLNFHKVERLGEPTFYLLPFFMDSLAYDLPDFSYELPAERGEVDFGRFLLA